MRYGPFALTAFGAGWLLCGVAGAASAQEVNYLAERGIGVADRSRPDYDPIPFRAGGLLVYPAIDATAIYTDNFRATATGREGEAYAVIRPSVRATTNWGRHAAEVTAYYEQPLHTRLSQENVAQFGGTGLGRYDISRSTTVQLLANGVYGVESRTDIGSFIGSVNPVKFDSESVSLTAAHDAGDLQLSVAGGASRRGYRDVRAADGTFVSQRFRDVRSIYASANVSYRVGPGLSVVITGEVDRNDYPFRPGSPGFDPTTAVDRRSTGYMLEGGVNFELTALVIGTVQVGLLRRDYRDPRLPSFAGPSVTAQILWNVTPLTTVRLNVARTVEDTASIGVAGNLRTRIGLSADHELFRYVIVTPDLVYSHISAIGSLPVSNELAFGISTRYLIDRHFSVVGKIRHAQRTSDLQLYQFRQNTISASLRYNF